MPANHESLAIWVDANTWILSLKQWQLQAQAVTQQSLVDNLIFSKLKQNYSIWQFKLVEPSLFDIVLAKVVHKYALIDASFWQPLLYFFYLTASSNSTHYQHLLRGLFFTLYMLNCASQFCEC